MEIEDVILSLENLPQNTEFLKECHSFTITTKLEDSVVWDLKINDLEALPLFLTSQKYN